MTESHAYLYGRDTIGGDTEPLTRHELDQLTPDERADYYAGRQAQTDDDDEARQYAARAR